MISDHQQGVLRVLDLAQDAGDRVPRQDDEINRGLGAVAPVTHPLPHPSLPRERRRRDTGTDHRSPAISRCHCHRVQLDRGGPAEHLLSRFEHLQAPLRPIHRRKQLFEAGLIFRNEQAGDLAATDHGIGGQPQARMGSRSPEESAEHQQVGVDLLRAPHNFDAGDPGAQLRPLGIHPRSVRAMHHTEHIQVNAECGGEAPSNGNRVMSGGRPICGREDLTPCHG